MKHSAEQEVQDEDREIRLSEGINISRVLSNGETFEVAADDFVEESMWNFNLALVLISWLYPQKEIAGKNYWTELVQKLTMLTCSVELLISAAHLHWAKVIFSLIFVAAQCKH